MAERYFKRYRMMFDCRRTSIPEPRLPPGYVWVPWSEHLLEVHATVKAESFRHEIDAVVFPCLGELAGCRKLMSDIAAHANFLPSATWLIQKTQGPAPQYCGTIQGMARFFRAGAIQNVGILPDCRGLGMGRALVSRALIGFSEKGVRKVFLEVTAMNHPAVQLYERIGFRIENVSYQAANIPDDELNEPPDLSHSSSVSASL